MGRVGAVIVHVHLFQGAVHSAANFRAGNAQIFRAESNVLLHHIRHDLVVRVLENHAHVSPNGDKPVFIGGVDAADVDLSPGGQQNGVEMLGKGGFSAAVGAEYGNKAAFFNGQIQIRKHGNTGRVLHARVRVCQMLYRNYVAQIRNPPICYGVHRPVAPQGRTSPDCFTGSPSSPAAVLPPCAAPNTTSEA